MNRFAAAAAREQHRHVAHWPRKAAAAAAVSLFGPLCRRNLSAIILGLARMRMRSCDITKAA